jgi:PAS domain S-box-containing protein
MSNKMSTTLDFKNEATETIFCLLKEAILIVNDKGYVVYINHAAEVVFDINVKGVIGQHVDLILSGLVDINSIWDEKLVSREISLNNKEFLCTAKILKNNSKVTGAALVFQDLSDIKTKDRELVAANETIRELDAIFKFSYDGIFVTDGNAIGLKVNKAYTRVTGIQDAANLIGMHMKDAVLGGYVSESVTLKVLEKRATVSTMPKVKSGKQVLMTGNPVFNENGEIIRVITNVRDISELIELHSQLREARELSERYYSELLHLRSQQMKVEGVVIESQVMKGIFETALKVANTEATVLVTGDSGSGKEILARVIHNHSEHKSGPFFKINCGAIPENLLESELFGYEKGAFTNASKNGKPGLFEMASGGTVFLDEIGEIPLSIQAKLLGVLQDRRFTRVGGIEQKPLNARVVAATNRDLETMIDNKQFRKDLYYRLNVVALKIPPLVERNSDIFPLAHFFLAKFNKRYKTNKELSTQVIDAFMEYDWPGNVREMENLIERLVVLSQEERITLESLPESMKNFRTLGSNGEIISGDKGLTDIIEDVERRVFQEYLQRGYSTRKIAQELRISQATVVRKINHLIG